MKITASLALLVGFNEAKRFSFVDHPLNCRAAGVDVEQTGLETTNCNPSSKRCQLVCKTTEGFQRVGAGNFRCRRNNKTGRLCFLRYFEGGASTLKGPFWPIDLGKSALGARIWTVHSGW